MMIFQKIKLTRNIILSIIAIIIVALFFIFFSQIRNACRGVVNFFDHKAFIIRKNISNFSNNFNTKQELIDENNRLLATISEYENNLVNYKILKRENERVYSSGSLKTKARVLSSGELASSSKLIIENINFKIKDPVYAGSVFLGYIGELYEDKAIVELQSKSGYKIDAQTENGMVVTLKGEGNQTFTFEISSEEKIELNELIKITTSSDVIGVVRKILVDPKTPYKTIYVTYPLNLNYLDSVDVISYE